MLQTLHHKEKNIQILFNLLFFKFVVFVYTETSVTKNFASVFPVLIAPLLGIFLTSKFFSKSCSNWDGQGRGGLSSTLRGWRCQGVEGGTVSRLQYVLAGEMSAVNSDMQDKCCCCWWEDHSKEMRVPSPHTEQSPSIQSPTNGISLAKCNLLYIHRFQVRFKQHLAS